MENLTLNPDGLAPTAPPPGQPRVRGLRGATTLEVDEREHLLDRVQELVRAMFERNALVEDDLVSVVFTATDDIHSAFPAEAARVAGMAHVPLLCARELEIDAVEGLDRCIRVLMTAYTTRSATELRHVYLHDARQLRTDLPE